MEKSSFIAYICFEYSELQVSKASIRNTTMNYCISQFFHIKHLPQITMAMTE